jgi:hypothetical protein
VSPKKDKCDARITVDEAVEGFSIHLGMRANAYKVVGLLARGPLADNSHGDL